MASLARATSSRVAYQSAAADGAAVASTKTEETESADSTTKKTAGKVAGAGTSALRQSKRIRDNNVKVAAAAKKEAEENAAASKSSGAADTATAASPAADDTVVDTGSKYKRRKKSAVKVETDDVESEEAEKEAAAKPSKSKKSGGASAAAGGGESMLIDGKFTAKLSNNIKKEYNNFVGLALRISDAGRKQKKYSFSSSTVSVNDLVAYQIGWGQLVVNWYDTGVKGKMPQMPGDGFTEWKYNALAAHFYKSYQFGSPSAQHRVFKDVTERIIAIVEKESKTGNLDKEGAWEWQKLKSGKYWPLSKWVQVNTVAPFSRAAKLIK
jgi:hypothetical protein